MADNSQNSAPSSVLPVRHSNTSLSPTKRLERPVAIPQSHNDIGMPFARAYSEVLVEHGISKEVFVQFIDDLNVATASSPPFQYLDIAGEVLGFIPIPHSQWIGMGIQAGAQTTQAATSLIREKLFVKKKNEEIFVPRGLKVEVMKGKTLKRSLGLPPDAPITASVDESVRAGLSVHERRMAGIKHLTAPLIFDVPPPSEATTNFLNKMHAKQQAKKLQEQEDKASKHRDRYQKALGDHTERADRKRRRYAEELERLQSKIDKQEQERKRSKEKTMSRELPPARRARKLREIDEEADHEIKYIKKRIRDHTKEHEGELDEMSKELQEEDREAQIGDKVYWVLVQNL